MSVFDIVVSVSVPYGDQVNFNGTCIYTPGQKAAVSVPYGDQVNFNVVYRAYNAIENCFRPLWGSG